MRNSILILVLAAFTLVIAGLAINAFAECATCMTEGDWSQSADSFIAGTPVSEEAPAWGPKVVRQKNSQFENNSADKTGAPSDASSTSESAANAPKSSIDLVNISSMPAPVSSGSAVKIIAALRESNSAGTSSAGNESMITALATIRDSTGKEVGKVSLQRSSEHEYSGVWNAKVAAGVYKVSIAAASLQATGKFEDALDLEVVEAAEAGSGNATSSAPAIKDLG
jgi:hypothetical protein